MTFNGLNMEGFFQFLLYKCLIVKWTISISLGTHSDRSVLTVTLANVLHVFTAECLGCGFTPVSNLFEGYDLGKKAGIASGFFLKLFVVNTTLRY